MKAKPARLDADRQNPETPLTSIVQHIPIGGAIHCFGVPLRNPEYVAETGERISLIAEPEDSEETKAAKYLLSHDLRRYKKNAETSATDPAASDNARKTYHALIVEIDKLLAALK